MDLDRLISEVEAQVALDARSLLDESLCDRTVRLARLRNLVAVAESITVGELEERKATDGPPRVGAVAYDEDLADRIRELLAEVDGVAEKPMFGGLAFLVGGHMAVTASGKGGIMVRVEPGSSDHLIATTAAGPMEMRGRQLDGWVRVDADHVRTKRQLAPWVRRGSTYAASLPAKTVARKPTRRGPA